MNKKQEEILSNLCDNVEELFRRVEILEEENADLKIRVKALEPDEFEEPEPPICRNCDCTNQGHAECPSCWMVGYTERKNAKKAKKNHLEKVQQYAGVDLYE